MTKYYKVVAKCGHVGRNNYIEVAFAIAAQSIYEATLIARYLPRVKHHRKDAISFACEISNEEYMVLKSENNANPYLKCKSIQEQKLIYDNIAQDIKPDIRFVREKKTKRECVKYRLRKEKEYLSSHQIMDKYQCSEYYC